MKSPFSSIDLEGYFTFSLTVKNSGLGPALIENYSISIGNDEDIFSGGLFDTIQKHAREHFKAKGKIRCGVAFLRTGDAIDKGEEKVLIEINFPKEGVPFKQARDLARRYSATIAAKIEYRCHYGNKFQSEKLTNKKLQSVADPHTVSSTEMKTDDLDDASNLQHQDNRSEGELIDRK
ncbi:hypothetical protein AO262_22700 [Pseudomonas fluorescens ABAC62]|nr:hypothetical protein AO262_22700 [Pseudomonas fluorescens ABAC62]